MTDRRVEVADSWRHFLDTQQAAARAAARPGSGRAVTLPATGGRSAHPHLHVRCGAVPVRQYAWRLFLQVQ